MEIILSSASLIFQVTVQSSPCDNFLLLIHNSLCSLCHSCSSRLWVGLSGLCVLVCFFKDQQLVLTADTITSCGRTHQLSHFTSMLDTGDGSPSMVVHNVATSSSYVDGQPSSSLSSEFSIQANQSYENTQLLFLLF